MNRPECEHKTLFFGSGDYYVFCQHCDARWVCCGSSSDLANTHLANRGVGRGLSGQVRSNHE